MCRKPVMAGLPIAPGPQFRYNKKEGIAKIYAKNGSVIGLLPYKNDVLHGVVKKFYEDGNKASETAYEYGKQNGLDIWYYPNAKVKVKYEYEDGVLRGTVLNFDEDGKIVRKAIGMSGYIVQEEENPQQNYERKQKNLLLTLVAAILAGCVCGIVCAKFKGRK